MSEREPAQTPRARSRRAKAGGSHRGKYGIGRPTGHETRWEARPARKHDYVNGGSAWCYRCSGGHRWAVACGVPPVAEAEALTCKQCGRAFYPPHGNVKAYCGDECRCIARRNRRRKSGD